MVDKGGDLVKVPQLVDKHESVGDLVEGLGATVRAITVDRCHPNDMLAGHSHRQVFGMKGLGLLLTG